MIIISKRSSASQSSKSSTCKLNFQFLYLLKCLVYFIYHTMMIPNQSFLNLKTNFGIRKGLKSINRLFLYFTGNLRSNTTPCWPRLVFIIIRETTMNWELLAENISVFVRSQSLIPEILISFGQCPKERLKKSEF